MGLSAVSAEVSIDDADRLYTGGDIISGRVTVTLKKSKAIKMVEIALRCTVYAVVRLSSDTVLEFRHHIHEDKVCVFPEPGMDVIDKGGYSMPEGDYEYPFQFQLPASPTLPQSLPNVSEGSSIFWNIKVKVTRSGAINVRESERFLYTPLGPHSGPQPGAADSRRLWTDATRKFRAHNPDIAHGFMSRLSRKNQTECQVDGRLTFSEAGLEQAPLKTAIGMELICSHPDMVVVQKVRLWLKSRARLYDDDRKYSSQGSSKTLVFAELEPQLVLQKSNNLNDLLAPLEFPARLAGSVEVMNILYSYRLFADIVLASKHCPSYTKKLSLVSEVLVLPPRPAASGDILPGYCKIEQPPAHPLEDPPPHSFASGLPTTPSYPDEKR